MACNRPFSVRNSSGEIVLAPCGWCRQCRIDRREEWTHRIMSEISLHDGAFLTLTYNDLYLPSGGSLVPNDLTLFLKRFRQNLSRSRASGRKIKYYAVGEYGSVGGYLDLYDTGFGRPHYHLIISGLDPYNVDSLARQSWSYGFIKTEPANPSTVRYTLKYLDKQIVGKDAESVYGSLVPPFARMSKGLGLEWMLKNSDSIAENNGYYVKGRLVPPPRYYKRRFGVSSSPSPDSPKYKRLKEYMDLHNCTLEQASNALGLVNEQALNDKDNLHI